MFRGPNSRHDKKDKRLQSKYGEIPIAVPQDRENTFYPRVVKKQQKDIPSIEDKIISTYTKGMRARQISEQIDDIYGFEVSEELVSDITDKLLPQIEEW